MRYPKPIHQREDGIVESGKHLGFARSPHLRMIFVQGDIAPPMQTVFNGPMIPQEGSNDFWTGLSRGQIGEAIDDLLAGFFHEDHLLAFFARLGLWGRRDLGLARRFRFAGLGLLLGLLDHSAALALDGAGHLKALSDASPLGGKPVIHFGARAHRARGESSMTFFRVRKEAPGTLIGIRVFKKQREVFMSGGMIVLEKEEVLASQLVN